MKKLLNTLIGLPIFLVIFWYVFIPSCKPVEDTTKTASQPEKQEVNVQQEIYDLCKSKGGVPILDNHDRVMNCLFKCTSGWNQE